MPIEIVSLGSGHYAPPGAHWMRLFPLPARSCGLTGSIPVPNGVMSRYGEYPNIFEAEQAAIAYAMQRGCILLYLETD